MSLTFRQIRLTEFVRDHGLHKQELRSDKDTEKLWEMLGTKYFSTSGHVLQNEWSVIKEKYYEEKKTNEGVRVFNGVLDFLDEINESHSHLEKISISEIVSLDDTEEITVFISTNESGNESEISISEGDVVMQKVDKNITNENSLTTKVKEVKTDDDTLNKPVNSLLDIDCINTDTRSFFKKVAAYADQLPVGAQRQLKFDILAKIVRQDILD